MIKISELYIYPVKSLAGIQLSSATLSPFGLLHDRRWVIVDENGLFLSQRTKAKMATIATKLDKQGHLTLTYNNTSIEVPKSRESTKKINVSIWNDHLLAQHTSTKVDEWLSAILEQKCHLVYMPQNAERQIDPDFAKANQFVSFADAFPFLAISQASLDNLNQRLKAAININRFRPNIVVDGCQAFAEDHWQEFAINHVEFISAKPCSRCIMPSINQETGQQDQKHMLAVLNRYRQFDKKIKFGQNILYKNSAKSNNQKISIGDEIKLK